MADMSISGIASGIDWESMAEKLLEKAKAPAYAVLDKRDKLESKKSYYEEFRVALQNLQTTLSPLKLASTFKAKTIEIDRLDSSASYKSVLTATVNADAVIDVHDLEVLKLAKGQTQRSNQLSGGQLSSVFTSANGLNGVNNSYFYINAGGKKIRIAVSSQDTLDSLAKRINAELKNQTSAVGVTASVVDNKLILKSDNTGLGTSNLKNTIKRSINAYDTLDFLPDSSAINGGKLVVKRTSDGKTYKEGVDFDIVDNQIRWRDYQSDYVPAGGVYQATYTAGGTETYTAQGKRASSGNTDEGVFSFTPQNPSTTVSITGYTYGTDYVVDGKNIRWLSTNKPAEGSSYNISYAASAGETFTLNVDRNPADVLAGNPTYAAFAAGTATIKHGTKTYTQGIDFDIVNTNGEATVRWKEEAGYGVPAPGSAYSVTLKKSDGSTSTYTASRSDADTVDPTRYGFTNPTGTLAFSGYNGVTSGWNVAVSGGGGTPFTLTWASSGALTNRPDVPQYGQEYTVEYTYNSNTFSLSDDGNGMLAALGLDLFDTDHFVEASDAELMLNGEKVTRSSNHIGESFKNELIKGMTLELKGLGRVSLDVSQDAEAAVKAVDSFVTAYNDILKWIDTRLTEKALDENTKATIDSDDFRWKWGVLNGSSLLRSTKNSMRLLTSKVITSSFTARSSRQSIYGTMAQNGIVNTGYFSLTVGARTANISVKPTDTVEMIAAKINDTSKNSEAYELHYDADGRQYPTPFVKASVENGKLVFTAGTDRPVTLGGSNAVQTALGVNYQYSSLSQIGIKAKSTGQASAETYSGQLEFDSAVFMKALEANAEDVSLFVTAFAKDAQTFMDSMIKATQKNIADGVAAAEGSVVREISAIDNEIKSIDKYLAEFQRRLDNKKESLYTQFAAAETSLAKLMQQASWLTSVTSQLQGASSSSGK